METVVKVIVALKIVGLALFAIVLLVSFCYTIVVGPDDPESTHGHTAVCKDGTVLPPPWNVCGEEHGDLDHWTTGPTASATETIGEEPRGSSIPPDAVDDILGHNVPDVCTDADARGEVPRDLVTPCGQLLGYFDDSATPTPGAPVVP